MPKHICLLVVIVELGGVRTVTFRTVHVPENIDEAMHGACVPKAFRFRV